MAVNLGSRPPFRGDDDCKGAGLPSLRETMRVANARVNGDDFWQSDFESALEKIQEDPQNVQFVSYFIEDYKKLAQVALEKDPSVLEFLRDDCRNDFDLVFLAIDKDGRAFRFAGEECKKNAGLAFHAVSRGCSLIYILLEMRVQDRFIETALKQNGDELEVVRDICGDMEKYVSMALENCPSAFRFASDRIKRDREIILHLMQVNWKIIQYVDIHFRGDKDFIQKAVAIHPSCFRYASLRL